MIEIIPHRLYSKGDLARQLDGLMTANTFLLRLHGRLRNQFKGVYWGQDIIDALNTRTSEETDKPTPAGFVRPRATRRNPKRNPHFIDPAQYRATNKP